MILAHRERGLGSRTDANSVARSVNADVIEGSIVSDLGICSASDVYVQ